ncbi:hypothetical protein DXG01_002786, partial [Tephrocybe rancida]
SRLATFNSRLYPRTFRLGDVQDSEDRPFDFHSSYARAAWIALLPFIPVVTLTFFSLPLPISTPALLKTCLTLSEAKVFAPSDPSSKSIKPNMLLKPLPGVPSLPPVVRPTPTVPYDLFAVYSALFVGALLQLGGVFYDHGAFVDEWPSVVVLVALWAKLVVTTGVLGVVLGMPLALPGRTVKEEELQITLLRKLFTANSLDLFLDFSLTLVSVCFNYAGLFFLNRILDAIDLTSPMSESRAQAYVYVVLAFICSLCKSQADVQHLWFGRRAATRIRSELMVTIHDKPLKRSGIVDQEKKKAETEAADKDGKSKKDEEKSDKAKAGADVSKINNLMAGGTNRVSMTVTASYFIYGALFEIILASIFLYKILGLTAFAGFFVRLLGWLLSSYIARRSIRIQKGLLGARDRRMGVLSEMMGAVKFINMGELGGVLAAVDLSTDINLDYLVLCAIALFNIVHAPLNVIPTWIVQIPSKSPSKLDSHSNGRSYSPSYAALAPWLSHQSIQDNILFGAPFDSARYDPVLDACALHTDLDVLEDGDLAEIGARGVSLSGGQKVTDKGRVGINWPRAIQHPL